MAVIRYIKYYYVYTLRSVVYFGLFLINLICTNELVNLEEPIICFQKIRPNDLFVIIMT